jgi:hypothetical protein
MKLKKNFRIAESDLEIRESEDGNSILVLWSTGAKGLRSNFDGKFYEELDMSEQAVDLTRLNKKAPFLLQHNQDISAQIGVVERAWLQEGMGMAEVRLSKRPDVSGYVQDIKDGILRNISVGYRVNEYTDVTPKGEKLKTYRATSWTPMELSCVAVGFDADAGILRSEDETENEVKIINRKNQEVTMEDKKESVAVSESQHNHNNAPIVELKEAPQVEEPQQDLDAIKRQAVEEFQTRCKEINQAVKASGLDQTLAEDFISRGLGMDEVSKEIFKQLEANASQKQEQKQSNEVKMTKREMAELALLNRIDADRFKVERENPYKQQSFVKIIEGMVERNPGESDSAFVKRATVSGDLQDLLANVANKLMQSTEGLEKFQYRKFAGQQTLKDFRTTPIVQISGVVLNSKAEGEDYQKATLVDSKENITLEERGIIVEISQKAIVNDDLGALKALPRQAQASGHRDIEKRMFAMLASNGGDGPTLVDTNPLFHASHSNTLDGEMPTPEGIAAANEVMGAFTDDSGEPLDLRTKVILCGNDLEMVARQTASNVNYASKAGNVNPYAGELEVAVSSRIPAGVWYAICDKDDYAALVYGTLEGMAEPNVEAEVDFNSSNHKVKIEYPNAVAAASHKGIVRVTAPGQDGEE